MKLNQEIIVPSTRYPIMYPMVPKGDWEEYKTYYTDIDDLDAPTDITTPNTVLSGTDVIEVKYASSLHFRFKSNTEDDVITYSIVSWGNNGKDGNLDVKDAVITTNGTTNTDGYYLTDAEVVDVAFRSKVHILITNRSGTYPNKSVVIIEVAGC